MAREHHASTRHRKTEHPADGAQNFADSATEQARSPDAGTTASGPEPRDAKEPAQSREELERRVREAEEIALRAQADLQNVKRRHREDIQRIQETATKNLAVAVLPVIDDMERALDAASSTQNFEGLRTGVELTLNKLLQALRTVGVERMEGVGARFDPNLHEAVVRTEPSEEHPSGTISQELRPGYTQNGHVIRPSMVAVASD